MMRVEAAGQRAERRHDDLVRRHDEAAPRDLPALEVEPQLGMEMAGDFGPRLAAHGFVAKDDPADLDFVLDSCRRNGRRSPDRGCRRSTSSRAVAVRSVSSARALAGSRSQPNAVMEAVAEAIEPLGAGALDLGGERGQRRVRIIRRKELAEPREPARFLEVQVGDQQRLCAGQNSAPSAVASNVSPANEKGTMLRRC